MNTELELIAGSIEPFPVDFDRAWQWIGYSRKDAAKRILVENFAQDVDFSSLHITVEREIGATTREEIRLTVDCFKSFCMMAGTDQGRRVRAYFLECERRLRLQIEQPRTAIEWAQAFIRVESERIRLEAEARANAPKIADWEALMATKNSQKIGTIAKVLGFGPNKFFRQLRADGILTGENLPASQYAHLFEVVVKTLPNQRSQSVTLVRPDGMSFLARRYTMRLIA